MSHTRSPKSSLSEWTGGGARARGRSPAAPCWASQPQLSANAEPRARIKPARGRQRRVALEREVRLRRERGDPDPRQVAPPFVDDEATLPAREELLVEREQVVELEVSFQRAQRAPLQLLLPGQLGVRRKQRGERREVERHVVVVVVTRPLTAAQMSHSLKPFGVERSRGIDESESDRDAGERAKWRNPAAVPSGAKPTTKTACASSRANSVSSAIANPRSGCVAAPVDRDRLDLLAQPAAISLGRSARAVKPACSRRCTDWRTFRIERPRARTPRCRRSPRRRGRARAARVRRRRGSHASERRGSRSASRARARARRSCRRAPGRRRGGPIGIAGDDCDAADDAVGEERRLVVVEEVRLVGAEDERRQRVDAPRVATSAARAAARARPARRGAATVRASR